DEATRLTFLRGLNESLKGRRDVKPPAAWKEVSAALAKTAAGDLKMQLAALNVAFGDEAAIDALHQIARDTKYPIENRRHAVRTLIGAKAANTSQLLRQIVMDPFEESSLRGDAMRGLASFDDENTPYALLQYYGLYTPELRRDTLATLCTRPAYAVALFDAMEAGGVPKNHLTADLVTNLRNLNDAALNKRIEQVWGIVRSSPADKKKLIDDYKRLLTQARSASEGPGSDSAELGRAVFMKTCQQCHTLFGTGGKVGPDITGSQRANLDYLFSNIVDPSAVMAKEYQPTVVRCADGRVVTGILKEETAAAISLATQNEVVVIPKADIEESKISDKSMMPDDLLKPLTPLEVRSLVAYLSSEIQTPIAATPDNVSG
ncbi:MAG: c-type cytochrome, partial [Planctomycetia bacterium]|nr:c-type cytochrome [Planctomycetia bacterium]